MRKSMWVVLAAAILAICAPYAHANSITDGTFNFTVTSGSPAPTGSFVWDSTTNTWTSFTVDWDGVVFNFSPLIPTLAALATSGNWCAGSLSSFTTCTPKVFTLDGFATGPEAPTYTDGFAAARGSYTVTETPATATPEPGSFALLLIALGALPLVVGRKRIGHTSRSSA